MSSKFSYSYTGAASTSAAEKPTHGHGVGDVRVHICQSVTENKCSAVAEMGDRLATIDMG